MIRGGGRGNHGGGSSGSRCDNVALAMGTHRRARQRGSEPGNQVPDEQRKNPDA